MKYQTIKNGIKVEETVEVTCNADLVKIYKSRLEDCQKNLSEPDIAAMAQTRFVEQPEKLQGLQAHTNGASVFRNLKHVK